MRVYQSNTSQAVDFPIGRMDTGCALECVMTDRSETLIRYCLAAISALSAVAFFVLIISAYK